MLAPFSAFAARDATIVSPPDAPTELQAAQAGTNQVQLRWVYGLGSDTFEIDRSADGGAFSQIDTAGVGVRKYTDTGPLSDGVQYTYRVRATNATNGDSENSGTASVLVNTGVEFPDDSPEDLVASVSDGVDGQGAVTLTWTDTSSNEDEFEVLQDGVVVASPAAGSTTVQITGLDDETEYDWEVRAAKGGNSSITSAKIPQKTRLDDPEGVTQTLMVKFHHLEWTNESLLYKNVEVLNSGVLFDTLPKGTTEYDVARAQEETFNGSVRAIGSAIPDSVARGGQ